MPNALLIFNGFSFPQTLIQRAAGWAIQCNGSLTALFILSAELKEGQDNGNANAEIIESYTSLLKDMAVKAHTEIKTSVIVNPRQNDVLLYADNCEIIFALQDDIVFSNPELDLQLFLKAAPIPVELVRQ